MTTKNILTPCVPREDAKDYRYFPDPDLPPIHISDAWIEKIKKQNSRSFASETGPLSGRVRTSGIRCGNPYRIRHLAGLFEETAAIYGKCKEDSKLVYG